jgi:hypothetical protein
VTGSSWSGIGAGWGYLSSRELDVVVTAREIRSRHHLRIETGFRLAPVPVPAAAPPQRLVAV